MFGVVFIASYLFDTLSQSRHALANRARRMGLLSVVFGIYFGWFWSRGQTLAQKTWHIRVVSPTGAPVTQARAALRYVLCWPSVLFFGVGLVWAVFDRDRQFLHDRFSGARIVALPPVRKE